MSYENIRFILDKFNWEDGLGNVNILVNLMKKGDIVIVPDNNKRDIYFAEIISDYKYEKSLLRSDILNLNFRNKDQLNSLRTEAEQVLRNLLKSDNIDYRLRAAEIIFKNLV